MDSLHCKVRKDLVLYGPLGTGSVDCEADQGPDSDFFVKLKAFIGISGSFERARNVGSRPSSL